MAWHEKRPCKKGNTYRISVSCGTDTFGKQVKRTTNWKPEPGMTPRQEQKALEQAKADFERQIKQGYVLDQKRTFSEYADYVLDLKERNGIRPRTADRYRELLERTNQAIGHMKIADIRPQHLNAFYKNMSETGIRLNGTKAVVKVDFATWMKTHHLTRAELARRANISVGPITAAKQGKAISDDSAAAIAAAVGVPVTDLFDIEQDTSPLSQKTILEYHRLISGIFAQAEKEMLIPYNPAAKATPPKVQMGSPDYFQPEEIRKILQALENEPIKWKAITYLLIDTGCRRGEAAGLKWESLDLEHRTATIERALLYSPKRGVYEGPPKNGKIRVLTLSPEMITVLEEYRKAQQEWKMIVGDRWVDSGYVFTKETGEQINPDGITSWLRKFSADKGLPHIHPHAFRHTVASTLIATGIDLVTTAGELGHANATTTATIYAHQIATAKAKASNVRAGLFAQWHATEEMEANDP